MSVSDGYVVDEDDVILCGLQGDGDAVAVGGHVVQRGDFDAA